VSAREGLEPLVARYLEGELAELYQERPGATEDDGQWTAYTPIEGTPVEELSWEEHVEAGPTPEGTSGTDDAPRGRWVLKTVHDDQREWVLAGALDRLGVLEAVGILDTTTAAAWRTRFQQAWGLEAPEPDEHGDEPTMSRARAVLEEALSRVEPLRRGEEHNPEAESYFQGALDTFRALGVITDDEHTDWFHRKVERLSPGAAADLPPNAKDSLVVGLPFDEDEPWDDEDGPDLADFNLGPPRRIVIAPAERRHGLRLTAVQLHDQGLQVSWHLLIPREHEGVPDPGQDSLDWFDEALDTRAPEFELEDDAGSQHRSLGRESAGSPGGSLRSTGPHVLYGTHLFRGTVSQEATQLRIRAGVDHWVVPL
jgi:hypothetical protein